MGKGGTKFEGDAIGVRGKKFKAYTMKDRQKDLEEFQRTGVHPEIDAIAQKQRAEGVLLPLPDPDSGRPRTYMEFSANREVLGRVVFEVFQDLTPLPARAFVNRCRQSSTSTLQGSCVHKVQPNFGIYLGLSQRYKGEPTQLKDVSNLRHVEGHTVSMTPDGTEIAITLTRALILDASHLVVGRVQLGQDVLQKIIEIGVDLNDAPLDRVYVSACGMTNSKGVIEEDSAEAVALRRKAETPEQTAARLKAESTHAQDTMREAVQTALKRKVAATAAAAAAPASKLAKSPFDVLGGSDSSSTEDE